MGIATRAALPASLLLAAVALLVACGGGGGTYKGQSVSAYVKSVQRLQDRDFQHAAMVELVRDDAAAHPAWIGLLRCEDPRIAEEAASTLGSTRHGRKKPAPLSPDLRAALLEACVHADPAVRASAVMAVGTRLADDASVLQNLTAALGDSDPRVVRAALKALRSRESGSGTPDLARVREIAAKDSDLAVEACLTLAALGDAAPGVVDRLAACGAEGTPPAQVVHAVRALAALGPAASKAAPRLAVALEGAPDFRARDLADALGLIGDSGDAVRTALERALARKESSVRNAAALALLRLGVRDAKLEGILAEGLGSQAVLVSLRSAEGLLLLDRDPAKAWPVLVSMLTKGLDGFGVGDEAARALGRLAAAGKKLPADALCALDEAAAGDFNEVRRAAVEARARIPAK